MATVQERTSCVVWLFETKSVTKTQHNYRNALASTFNDITPLDLFLWGYIKSSVFRTPEDPYQECDLGYSSGQAPQNMARTRISSGRSPRYRGSPHRDQLITKQLPEFHYDLP
jgi:hypothetical protein